MRKTFRFGQKPKLHDVKEAESERRRIEDALEVMPETASAIDFATSVEERADSIMESVRRAGGATERQLDALENMAIGLEAWGRR